jgi:hypothetical protein
MAPSGQDAKKGQIDIVVCWRLDRLGRSLRHLIFLLEELTALGVGFLSLGEGSDTSTPAGRLQLHVLAAIADYAVREVMHSKALEAGCVPHSNGAGLRSVQKFSAPEISDCWYAVTALDCA